MKHLILAALAALTFSAAPAAAQSVSGCGTLSIAKADSENATRLGAKADCFGKVRVIATTAEDAHRARIAALATRPAPAPTAAAWVECAKEWGTCKLPGEAVVRFGANGRYLQRTISHAAIACTNANFGDAAPGYAKACQYQRTGRATKARGEAGPPQEGEVTSSWGAATGSGTLIARGTRAWPTPPRPTTRRGLLGVNIADTPWWGGDQTYANLVMGGEWRGGLKSYPEGRIPRADLGPNGYPRAELIGADYQLMLVLTPPYPSYTRDTAVHCTWAGRGDLTFEGNQLADPRRSGRTFDFTWKANTNNGKMVWLKLTKSDPADPIRDIDCRAEGVETTGIFTRQVVDLYSHFGTLRMLDASRVNGSGEWRAATRTLPGDITQAGDDGMALEVQAALAKAATADAWYNISWRADAEYQRAAAQIVHDQTPADRHVYVELSNEVWNYSFPVATMARDEAGVLKLGDGDTNKGAMLLYAQRTAALMKVWTEVFKDRPGQLIRVVAGPSDNAWYADVILGESGLAASGLVDAYAIAPYFGADLLTADKTTTDVDILFPRLAEAKDMVLTKRVPAMVGTVQRYGLPLIYYEAGQHLVDGEAEARVAALNRDSRMGAIYGDYIARLTGLGGGTTMLFNATGRISKWGAWGLREHAGQPIAETPKLKAVEDWLAAR